MKRYTEYNSNGFNKKCKSCKYFTSSRDIHKGHDKNRIYFYVEDKAVCSQEYNRKEEKRFEDSCWRWELAPDIGKVKLEIENEEKLKIIEKHQFELDKHKKQLEEQEKINKQLLYNEKELRNKKNYDKKKNVYSKQIVDLNINSKQVIKNIFKFLLFGIAITAVLILLVILFVF